MTQSVTTFTESTTQPRPQLPQTTSMAMSTANPPLTTTAQLTTTTVRDLQQTTLESNIGTGSETTLNKDPTLSTKADEGTSESIQQQLSTDDAQQKEEEKELI